MLQGGLMGYVAGLAYPGFEWQFFAVVIANAVFTIGYGDAPAMGTSDE